ncbi:MAG: flippase [Patescibacteria group bacterium]|nr:MAG: flippase [Patescibacteria group bacterium]
MVFLPERGESDVVQKKDDNSSGVPLPGKWKLSLTEVFQSKLARDGVWSIGLKIASVFLAFLLSVILARYLGPEGYGVYSFAYAMMMILAIPSMSGMPALMVRETARLRANGNCGAVTSAWRWGIKVSICVSIVIIFIFYLAVSIWDTIFLNEVKIAVYWGILTIPLLALMHITGAVIRGMGGVVKGQMPDMIVRPGMLIITVVGAIILNFEARSYNVMQMHAVSVFVAAGLAYIMLKDMLVSKARIIIDPLIRRQWLKSLLPLGLIASMGIVMQYIDLIMIGTLVNNYDVGIYRVSVQLAMLASFGLQAVNMAFAPYYARYYEKKEFSQIRYVAVLSARFVFVLNIVVVALYFAWGKQIIEIIYGSEYIQAYGPLMLLLIGQGANAFFGSVGNVLNMSGREMYTLRGMLVGVIVNVVLNVLLITRMGVLGAAVASVTAMLLWNYIMWKYVLLELGINVSVIGKIK